MTLNMNLSQIIFLSKNVSKHNFYSIFKICYKRYYFFYDIEMEFLCTICFLFSYIHNIFFFFNVRFLHHEISKELLIELSNENNI